ncbi:MAG: phosphoribosylglycinamide formyltransferase [Armatimonadaceae bacterium]
MEEAPEPIFALPPAPLALAVFVGPHGRGSNLMALHQATVDGRLPGVVSLVIGSRADAPALQRAADAGLRTVVVPPLKDEARYAERLQAALSSVEVNTLALAGYLRRLPSPIVEAFRYRVLNTHPALLPAFGGKGMYGEHVHRAVLAYGCKVSGCTVHFVDETYDTGPIIVQRAVPVLPEDTPETLASRILPVEHDAFIEALYLLANGRLRVQGRRVLLGEAVSPRSFSATESA